MSGEVSINDPLTSGCVRFASLENGDAGLANTRPNMLAAKKALDVKDGDLRRAIDRFMREWVHEVLIKYDSESRVRKALESRLDIAIGQQLATMRQEIAAAVTAEIRAKARAAVEAMPLSVSVSAGG